MSDTEANVQSLLSQSWKVIAKTLGEDFSDHTQFELKKEWQQCENSPVPELCIKNAVAMNPVLNKCRVVRAQINQWAY